MRHHQSSGCDNSGSHGSLFDNQPYDGMAMETPGDSGLFGSESEDEEVRAKQELHSE